MSRDVEMQAHCAYYAKMFNSYKPPRRVDFVKAWVLQVMGYRNPRHVDEKTS